MKKILKKLKLKYNNFNKKKQINFLSFFKFLKNKYFYFKVKVSFLKFKFFKNVVFGFSFIKIFIFKNIFKIKGQLNFILTLRR